MSALVSKFLTFSNGARLRTALYGGSHLSGNDLYVSCLYGGWATVVEFDNSKDADEELVSINERVDQWESAQAITEAGVCPVCTPKVDYVSDFLTFSTGARLHMNCYDRSNRSGSNVFIDGFDGEFSMIVELDSADDADLELASINEQVDRWEEAQEAAQAVSHYPSSED